MRCTSLSAFSSARLRFRPFLDSDLDSHAQLYSDPDVMRFVGPPRTLEQTRQRLRKHQQDHMTYGYGLFAAELHNGVFVGRCGIDPEGHRRASLAWMFATSYWGRGFATEFGHAILLQARKLDIKTLFATAHVDNVASIRMMQKIGMHPITQRNLQDGTEAVNDETVMYRAWCEC